MDVLEHLPAYGKSMQHRVRYFHNARRVHLTLWARVEERATPFSFVAIGNLVRSLYLAARPLALFSNQRGVTVTTPKVQWRHALLGCVFALEEEPTPHTIPASSFFALLKRCS